MKNKKLDSEKVRDLGDRIAVTVFIILAVIILRAVIRMLFGWPR